MESSGECMSNYIALMTLGGGSRASNVILGSDQVQVYLSMLLSSWSYSAVVVFYRHLYVESMGLAEVMAAPNSLMLPRFYRIIKMKNLMEL